MSDVRCANRPHRGRSAALLLAGVLALMLALAPRAMALVYWSGSCSGGWCGDGFGWIESANLDGSGVEGFILPISAPGYPTGDLAVDGAHIYWTNSSAGTIGRANLDGTDVEQSFISGLSSPGGIAVDEAHLYWTNSSTDTIGRAKLDGTGVEQSFISGVSSPRDVAVDGAHLYWTDLGVSHCSFWEGWFSYGSTCYQVASIGRAKLDGTNPEPTFITTRFAPPAWQGFHGLTVDGSHLYWITAEEVQSCSWQSDPLGGYGGYYHCSTSLSGGVGRASLDGTGVESNFIRPYSAPRGLAVDEYDYPLTAVDDEAAVAEDAGTTQIDVLANDTGVRADSGRVKAITQPGHGTATIAADRLSLSYEPDPDYCNDGDSTDDFTYSVSPGGSTATVAVSVSCVDDPPAAVDDSASVSQDSGPTQIEVLANDTNDGGPPALLTAVSQPDHGTATIAADQLSLSYEPDPGFCNNGVPSDDFTYTLNGGSTATVAVSVSCVDDPPAAVDDSAGLAEDAAPIQIDVLANDTVDSDGLAQVAAISQPNHGTATIAADRLSLSYEPDPNYCNDGDPTDHFTYALYGGSTATVVVSVSCVDDPPVAVDDSASVGEDSGATQINVLGNDTDVDGGPKQLTAAGQPNHGTATIAADRLSLSYEPDPDYCNDGDSTDDFTYALNGGSTATVVVSVSCVDDPPVAVDDSVSVGEDSGPIQLDVLANDTDDGGPPMQLASVSQAAHGTVNLIGSAAYKLAASYKPDPNYCNDGDPTDHFTYALYGGSTATVVVSVSCVDDPPVAVDDSASVGEDSGATQINVLGNDTDVDGGPKQLTAAGQPNHGTATIAADRLSLSYEPDPDYCNDGDSTDDFTYALNGGSTATVVVSVSCVDDPPVAVDDSVSVGEDSGATQINVLGNIAVPDSGRGTSNVRLFGRRRQEVDGPIEVTASCTEDCSLVAAGRILVWGGPGRAGAHAARGRAKKAKLGLRRVGRKLDAGTTATLKLRPRSQKARRRLRRMVRSGRKARAEIRLRIGYGTGNSSRARMTVWLRRR